MKVGKQLKIIVCGGVTLTMLSAVSVAAIARTDGTPVPANSDGVQLMRTQASTETPAAAESTLEERLQERIAVQGTRLNSAQTARLRTTCAAAQKVLVVYGEKVRTVESNRINAYDKILDHLNGLVLRLEGSVDTAELKTHISELQTRNQTFSTELNSLRQVVGDLGSMSCVDMLAGFQASLDTARLQRGSLQQQAASIRLYIQETIKPVLKNIKTELQSSNTEGAN